ncbi:hypothetical protein HJG54_17750 [Leptolyngbya sp. NK1-12]|uniref:Uncharacterized protein n=1 Tax=Leptolyngbya sp. NK1-12 TaxID=2547451 RepID=A0AA96WH54_9CYAN|nr:hypothetical protein [Leptolyngbya sp. NK1-12]WNZ24515.1 hypothetical protein HJG54_17750 [Leptolyngbya sp. NK1-12]
MAKAHIALNLPVVSEWEDESNFSFDTLWQQGEPYAYSPPLNENTVVNTSIVVYVFDGRSDGFSGSGGFNPFGHAAISVDGVFYNYSGEDGFFRTNEAIFNEFLVRPGVRVER